MLYHNTFYKVLSHIVYMEYICLRPMKLPIIDMLYNIIEHIIKYYVIIYSWYINII